MGFFPLKYRDQMQSPNPTVSVTATVDEFDNISAELGGWAQAQHNVDGSHNFVTSGLSLIPVGGIIQWHANVATPQYWKLCDGSVVSRTTYPLLWKAIGITYGSGDGVSTFALPSLNGSTPKYIILACV